MSSKKREHGTAPYSIPQFTEVLKAVAGALPKGLEGTDPKEVIRVVQKEGETLGRLLKGVFAELLQKRSRFLKLVSGTESLILAAVDGKEVLVDAKDIFAYIDPDFKKWGADEPGQATGETSVEVYEMAEDATFSQMFGSLSGDAQKLCFTQSQIKSFVKKYSNWLRTDGYATFFLFESRGESFVARVRVDSDGLGVSVDRFEGSGVWSAGYRHRVVVPQLA